MSRPPIYGPHNPHPLSTLKTELVLGGEVRRVRQPPGGGRGGLRHASAEDRDHRPAPERGGRGRADQDVREDYRVNGRKSTERAAHSVKRLAEHFAGVRVVDLTSDRVSRYIVKRQAEGASNGTINRELAALKRMLSLGAAQTPPKVVHKPRIPHLKENNIRTGYFERREFEALRLVLPVHLRPVVTLAYYTGMRRAEILGLKWQQVDFLERKITLQAGKTKNDDSRTIYMSEELYQTLAFLKAEHEGKHLGCEWVFHLDGQVFKDFRNSWRRACKAAGLEGKLFHDFRRTAVRNMVRAGVPERVAMAISGHKTRSIFDRYNIVNEADLKRAASKIEEHQRAAMGTISGTGASEERQPVPPSIPALH